MRAIMREETFHSPLGGRSTLRPSCACFLKQRRVRKLLVGRAAEIGHGFFVVG